MPDNSIRELILGNIKTRLLGIIDGAGYLRAAKLQDVERYIHIWRDDAEDVNTRGEEKILIRELFETGNYVASGQILARLEVDLEWVLIGDTANGEDISECLHDLKRALFQDPNALGGLARGMSYTNRLVEPETGMPTDGVHFVLQVDYAELQGDPTQSG
jgi:hypothetical protein